MLRRCVTLTEKQKKVLLIFACAVLLIVLLSFIEPGYGHICDKGYQGDPKNCPGYNVIAYSFWRFIGVANDYGTAITAFASIAIGLFTWTLWRSADRSGEHFRVSERAYVRMSHVSVSANRVRAVQWQEMDSGDFTVEIEVKNCGKTPARVTAVWLTCLPVPKGTNFPVNFSYGDEALSYDSGEGYTFLMPMDTFKITLEGSISAADRRYVDNKNGTLIVFGYVDYIDQFGDHHRAGYGRQYIPGQSGNNLGFPRVKAKLNYDEIRIEGVGWDWPSH